MTANTELLTTSSREQNVSIAFRSNKTSHTYLPYLVSTIRESPRGFSEFIWRTNISKRFNYDSGRQRKQRKGQRDTMVQPCRAS